MNTKTASIVVSASKDRVFSYLANIENLPKWATEFCREITVAEGKHKVITPMGEMFFHISTDNKTGVIDYFVGPTEDQMAIFPTRVVELPGGFSAYFFSMFQAPGVSDEEFQGQYESLKIEFINIRKEFE